MGRRRATPKHAAQVPPAIEDGDYWRTPEGHWWIFLDNAGAVALAADQVVEHADGRLTCSPVRSANGLRHGALSHGAWWES